MERLTVGLAVALVLGVAIERFAAHPAKRRMAGPGALAARLGAQAVVFLFWFALSWRPLLAATETLATIAILVAISIKKRRLVGEPLVFSDFALVRLVLGHPDLYYADFMRDWRALAGAAGVTAGIAAWFAFEPSLLPDAPVPTLLAVTAAPVALWGLWSAARSDAMAARLASLAPRPRLEDDIARWGLLLTLAIHALRWRRARAEPLRPSCGTDDPHAPVVAATASRLVVVQLESFMDPGRLGLDLPPLPGLERARRNALCHGSLRVPAHGAYTMRSEFAVLSGLPEEDLGFERFDPYLSADAGRMPTLASRLAPHGFRTVFIHPFRPSFFNRETALPRLGFQTLVMEQAFAGEERFGPHVSDRAVARRIIAEAKQGPDPVFIFAVTMENHGPWGQGRLPGGGDPLSHYLAHLANADRAIDDLVTGLSDLPGRTILCLFGDHPPILPDLAAPSPRPETDYVVLEFGPGRTAPAPRRESLSADALGRLVLRLALPAGVSGSCEIGSTSIDRPRATGGSRAVRG